MTEYCPFCDGELGYITAHDKWHCKNCDKYFKQEVDETEPDQKTTQESVYSKGKAAAVGFIVLMMILGIIICGYLAMPA